MKRAIGPGLSQFGIQYFQKKKNQTNKKANQSEKKSQTSDKSNNSSKKSNCKKKKILNEQSEAAQIIKKAYGNNHTNGSPNSTKILKKVTKTRRDSQNSSNSKSKKDPSSQKIDTIINNAPRTFKEPSLKDIFFYGFIPQDKQPKLISIGENKSQPYLHNSREQKHVYQIENRIAVNQFQYPFSAIGLLKMTFKINFQYKSFTGTAFLIGPKLLMTAAHNIYDHKFRVQAEKLQYYPSDKASKITDKEYIPIKVKTRYYPQQFKRAQNEDQRLLWDYAFIEIEKKIGYDYGYFGLDLSKKKQILNQRVYLYGYPGDLGIESLITNQEFKMYGQAGIIQYVQNQRKILYNISTTTGQSGSPVFHEIQGSYFVVAIHCQSGKKNQDANYGYLLNEDNIYIKNVQTNFESTKTEIQIDLKQALPQQLIPNFLSQKLPNLLKSKSLVTLHLSYCLIGPKGIKIIVQQNLPQLRYLILNNNLAGKKGAEYLKKGNWPHLSELRFGSNNIEAEGAQHLTNGNWKVLNLLYIENNNIGDQGAKKISYGKWSNLQFLDLQQNNIEYNGALFIKNNHKWSKLRYLRLKNNNISQENYRLIKSDKNIIFD